MTDLRTVLGEAVGAAFAAEGVDPALARVTPLSMPPLFCVAAIAIPASNKVSQATFARLKPKSTRSAAPASWTEVSPALTYGDVTPLTILASLTINKNGAIGTRTVLRPRRNLIINRSLSGFSNNSAVTIIANPP